MKRYQDCNLITKLYRRLKHQPYCFIRALLLTPRSYLLNSDLGVGLVFSLLYSDFYTKVNWMYSHREVWNDMRGEAGNYEE